tara:strand:- start:180 stop:557 length:378 start_codon:yes stop_codon:yes gene_type:complete
MSRYRNVKRISDRDQKNRMYVQHIYPQVPNDPNDTYLYASETDRYDLMADKFYGDPSLWYIIALANADSNTTMASIYPPLGKKIRIPANHVAFERRYRQQNNITIYTQTIKKRIFNTGYSRYTPK